MAWFVRLERRLGRMMTRAEHEHICERANRALEGRLDKIDQHLAKQDETSERHREKMREGLHGIAIDVTALQVKAGIEPRRTASVLTAGE